MFSTVLPNNRPDWHTQYQFLILPHVRWVMHVLLHLKCPNVVVEYLTWYLEALVLRILENYTKHMILVGLPYFSLTHINCHAIIGFFLQPTGSTPVSKEQPMITHQPPSLVWQLFGQVSISFTLYPSQTLKFYILLTPIPHWFNHTKLHWHWFKVYKT